jgi:hypothetical protein
MKLAQTLLLRLRSCAFQKVYPWASTRPRRNRGRKAAKRRVEIRPLADHRGRKPKNQFRLRNPPFCRQSPTAEAAVIDPRS